MHVEREAKLNVLNKLTSLVTDEHGRILLVHGEAGTWESSFSCYFLNQNKQANHCCQASQASRRTRSIVTPDGKRFNTTCVTDNENISGTLLLRADFVSNSLTKMQVRVRRKRRRFRRRKKCGLKEFRQSTTVSLASGESAHPSTLMHSSQQPTQSTAVPIQYRARMLAMIAAIVAFVWIGIGTVSNSLPQSMASALELLPASLMLGIIVIYMVSGMVKGALGIGMGLLAVPAVGILADPVLAVALVAVPLIVTNFHQGVIAGDLRKTLQSHALLAWIMMVVMTVTVFLAANFESSVIALTVGLSAIVFVILNLGIKLPEISEHNDKSAQILTGLCAGIIGGLTGLVVIPLVIYMMLRNIQKERFIAVSGFLLLLSGLALLLGGLLNGNLQSNTFILSAMVAVPSMFGIFIGERLRSRLSRDVFKKIILLVMLAIGLKTLGVQVLSI